MVDKSVIENAARFVLENKKLFHFVQRNNRYNDEIQLYSYSTKFKAIKNESPENKFASGVSFNSEIALMRMLGETIERFSLECFYPTIDRISPYKRNIPHYLDPARFSQFSLQQLQNESFSPFRIDNSSPIQWTEVISLMSGKTFYLPAHLTCIHFQFLEREPIITRTTSSGFAAGTSIEDALYRAILELVEHDSFMIHYLNALPSPRINLSQIQDSTIQKILQLYKRYNLELYVFDISTDLGIPVYLSLTIDRTGLGPSVSVGLKAGFNQVQSLVAAIEESLMTSTWVREEYPLMKKKITVTTIPHRAYYWYPTEQFQNLNFWLHTKNTIELKQKKNTNTSLDHLQSIFKKHQMDIFLKEITYPKIKNYGFSVVRAIIPELQSVYFDERFPFYGNTRLYKVPVTMGYHTKEKIEDNLNTIPHPLL